jgi:hypothetical protein
VLERPSRHQIDGLGGFFPQMDYRRKKSLRMEGMAARLRAISRQLSRWPMLW